MVHAITRACSKGELLNCACDPDKVGFGKDKRGSFEWGGCSDNVMYGSRFARKFVDARETDKRDARALMNMHNNRAGRRVRFKGRRKRFVDDGRTTHFIGAIRLKISIGRIRMRESVSVSVCVCLFVCVSMPVLACPRLSITVPACLSALSYLFVFFLWCLFRLCPCVFVCVCVCVSLDMFIHVHEDVCECACMRAGYACI